MAVEFAMLLFRCKPSSCVRPAARVTLSMYCDGELSALSPQFFAAPSPDVSGKTATAEPAESDLTMPSSTTKRALITGAGAADGIGFAIARQLGLAGHAVFLNGASARVLDRAAELCAEGINAKAAVADLTIAAEVARLRADVGAVEILVNNAGMGSLASP
ncbi:hypothetical protein X737_38515 [Mesorhizobium sp. L48C026A00]|nr:hypothetical protein X737_38515 [Mesorhizobium sp. L48C026A00]